MRARACPQLEDSQVDYRVIHRRSADSGADGCAATPFGTINGTGSRMFCPAAKGMLASPPRTTGYSSRRWFTVIVQAFPRGDFPEPFGVPTRVTPRFPRWGS